MSWIVYKHIAPNGKAYVGITSQKPNNRWKGGSGYVRKDKHQPLFENAIRKYGWDSFQHIIIASNLSFEEACKVEIEEIKLYKDKGRSYNITDGGEGFRGFKMSDMAKQKLKEAHLGKPLKEGVAEKIVKSRISNYDYIIIAVKGDIVYKFKTAKEAAEVLDIPNRCNISAAISGKQCLVKGYVFLHWGKGLPLDKKLILSIVNEKLNKRYKK